MNDDNQLEFTGNWSQHYSVPTNVHIHYLAIPRCTFPRATPPNQSSRRGHNTDGNLDLNINRVGLHGLANMEAFLTLFRFKFSF